MIKKYVYKLAKLFLVFKYRRKGFVYASEKLFAIGDEIGYVSAKYIKKIGGGRIFLSPYAQINAGCFFLSHDDIFIGENTAVAYNVTFLTSANPNAPYNTLSTIYTPMHAPIKIGKNCWVGANSVILPGVTIGDNCVIAAGSVVTRDVRNNVMVAGNPAVIKKEIP